MVCQRIDHRLGVDVGNRNGDGPAAESIDDCEKVAKAIRRRHGDEVHVNVLEPLWRYDKFCNRRHDVLLHFGLLTWDALPCPFAHIMFDTRPNEFVCD